MEAIGAELEERCHHLGAHCREMPMAPATWAIGVPAAMRWQSSSRPWGCVTHEDLRVGELASTPAHLQPEVFALVDPYRVTKVRERNN